MSFSCVCLLALMVASSYEQPSGNNWGNAALNKQCSMSSHYTNTDGTFNNCRTAINGNTTKFGPGNCIHTAEGDNNAGWIVDLGQNYTVERITIFARDYENQERMTNVNVSVDGVPVYQFPSNKWEISLMTDIQVSPKTAGSSLPMKGQRIMLSRNDLLNICEVQVWVCRPGYYGANCEACRPECSNTPCDDIGQQNTCPAYSLCNPNPCQQGGTCLPVVNSNSRICSCPPGYTGTICANGCDSQHYGVNCNNTCGAGCNGGTCDSVSGRCVISKCLPGFQQTPQCDQETSSEPLSGGSENLVGPIVGAILGAGVLICGTLLAVFCWKRRAAGSNIRNTTTRALPMTPVLSPSGEREAETSDTLPNPEQPKPVGESDVSVYEVIGENPYDALHPYSNDGTPKNDAYTSLRVTGKKQFN